MAVIIDVTGDDLYKDLSMEKTLSIYSCELIKMFV